MRLLVPALVLLCACTSTTTGTSQPSSGSCAPGIINGSPSLDLGRGATEFIPASDGDTWTAANGPQGGSHLWTSIRTTGMGPDVRLTYLFEELDGGILATTEGTAKVCAGPSPTTQERVGITAFLPDDDVTRDRLLCQGPFVLHVKIADDDHAAEARKRVGDVIPDETSFIPFRLRCDAGVPDGG